MQKYTAQKPIYKDGNVISEGTEFDTTQAHGRDLVKKGYAVQSGEQSDQHDAAPKAPEPVEPQAPEEAPTHEPAEQSEPGEAPARKAPRQSSSRKSK